MKTFRDLHVWQATHELVLMVYWHTNSFPKDERYGLISQMRRAAVSVAANIVEGYGRSSIKDKVRFYNYADASLEELKYFFILSADLRYIQDTSVLQRQADRVGGMLCRLTQATRRREEGSRKYRK